jgi:hypothetical protein
MSALAVKLGLLMAQSVRVNGRRVLSMVPLNHVFNPWFVVFKDFPRRVMDYFDQKTMERPVAVHGLLGGCFVRLADSISGFHAVILP